MYQDCCGLLVMLLGKPASCPAEIRVGTPLHHHQKLCVKRLEAATFGSHFPFEFSAADFGRHAAKVESQTDVLSALGRAAESLSREWGYLGDGVGFRFDSAASQRNLDEPASRPHACESARLPGSGPTVARPVVADRIKLPGPPRFNPQRFMDPRTAARYNDPLSLAGTLPSALCRRRSRSSPQGPRSSSFTATSPTPSASCLPLCLQTGEAMVQVFLLSARTPRETGLSLMPGRPTCLSKPTPVGLRRSPRPLP